MLFYGAIQFFDRARQFSIPFLREFLPNSNFQFADQPIPYFRQGLRNLTFQDMAANKYRETTATLNACRQIVCVTSIDANLRNL